MGFFQSVVIRVTAHMRSLINGWFEEVIVMLVDGQANNAMGAQLCAASSLFEVKFPSALPFRG